MMTHIIIAIVCFLCFDLTLLRHKRCIQVAFVGIFVGFLLSSTKSAYKSTRAGTARIIHNFKRPAALISADAGDKRASRRRKLVCCVAQPPLAYQYITKNIFLLKITSATYG